MNDRDLAANVQQVADFYRVDAVAVLGYMKELVHDREVLSWEAALEVSMEALKARSEDPAELRALDAAVDDKILSLRIEHINAQAQAPGDYQGRHRF
jgi:hypothetical protein